MLAVVSCGFSFLYDRLDGSCGAEDIRTDSSVLRGRFTLFVFVVPLGLGYVFTLAVPLYYFRLGWRFLVLTSWTLAG